eukprot:4692377-Prymnesium_polylepis.1
MDDTFQRIEERVLNNPSTSVLAAVGNGREGRSDTRLDGLRRTPKYRISGDAATEPSMHETTGMGVFFY